MARRSLFRAASSFFAILILAAGCSDLAPTAPQLESSTIAQSNDNSHAQLIGPRANVVRVGYKKGVYAATIGKQGGTIDFGIGTIDFPAGAVDRPTRITVSTDGRTIGAEFGPEGLHFPIGAQPRLTLYISEAVDDLSGARIAYFVDGQIAAWLTSQNDGVTVVASLPHFSAYAVAKD